MNTTPTPNTVSTAEELRDLIETGLDKVLRGNIQIAVQIRGCLRELAALKSQQTEGWQLVPVEATQEMLDATKGSFDRVNGILAQHQHRYGKIDLKVDGQYPLWHAYKAMLAAAPKL